MGYCREAGFKVHYCTATLKDKVQFYERIKRRAKNIALPTDIITREGTLKRGTVYLRELKPSFGYNKKMEEMPKEERQEYVKQLNSMRKYSVDQFKLKENELHVDERKLRLLTSTKLVNNLKLKYKHLRMVPAIVEEYPTWDQLEIEIMFL